MLEALTIASPAATTIEPVEATALPTTLTADDTIVWELTRLKSPRRKATLTKNHILEDNISEEETELNTLRLSKHFIAEDRKIF